MSARQKHMTSTNLSDQSEISASATFTSRVTFVLFCSLPIYKMQLIILNWWDRYIGGAP